MSEDTHGLQCKGRLINLDTESGKRIYGALKESALDGLSIGYTVGEFTRGAALNFSPAILVTSSVTPTSDRPVTGSSLKPILLPSGSSTIIRAAMSLSPTPYGGT
jgi:hypothetical protein